MTEPSDFNDTATPPGEDPELVEAVRALLVPLARLAVARGLTYSAVDEMLRSAFVAAAHAAHPTLPEHRRVSRISAATGIHRREVTRLLGADEHPHGRARSFPNEIFAHWTTDSAYRDTQGHPATLPRLGPAPSFESLAHEITRDVHPRSLLEELLRLGLATHDAVADTVALAGEYFVPRGDRGRLENFLGANVGDHLAAAVDNVLGDGARHFEQAIFADGLSPASVAALREVINAQWRSLTNELVPRLEKMIAADAPSVPADGGQRVRLGLFSYHAPARPAAPATGTVPAPRARRPRGDTP